MKSLKNLLFVLLITSFVFTACEKEEVEKPFAPSTTTDLSGFGNREGAPSGTVFQLPDNIKLTSQIFPYAKNDSIYQHYGVGMIYTYFTLFNNNKSSSVITLPSGLIFIPDNDSSQTIISLRSIKLTLPPQDSLKVNLLMFCANQHMWAGYANYYNMNVVSNNDQITTLVNNVSKIEETILLNEDHTFTLQNIVWSITDGDGLCQTDLDTINSW